MTIENPDNHPPLVIASGTGPGKHRRAVELRDERWRSRQHIDDLPVVLRLHQHKPGTFRAFADLAAAGYQVIGVLTGDAENVAQHFTDAGVELPTGTAVEAYDEEAYRIGVVAANTARLAETGLLGNGRKP